MKTCIIATALALTYFSTGPLIAQGFDSRDFNIVTNGKIYRFSDIDLGRITRGAYRDFKRGTQFAGAFYISPSEFDGYDFWYERDMHNLEDAKLLAKTQCEFDTELLRPCILYATIEANQKSTTPFGQFSLSKSLSEFIESNLFQLDEGTSGFVALSANFYGNWEFSEILDTEEQAIKAADRYCDNLAAQGRERYEAAFISHLNRSTGRDNFECNAYFVLPVN